MIENSTIYENDMWIYYLLSNNMIIKVINKDSEPERYAFTEDKVIIGRNPSTETSVQLDSETISRKHLAARVRNGVIQIKDLNSSNVKIIQVMDPSLDKSNLNQIFGTKLTRMIK